MSGAIAGIAAGESEEGVGEIVIVLLDEITVLAIGLVDPADDFEFAPVMEIFLLEGDAVYVDVGGEGFDRGARFDSGC